MVHMQTEKHFAGTQATHSQHKRCVSAQIYNELEGDPPNGLW